MSEENFAQCFECCQFFANLFRFTCRHNLCHGCYEKLNSETEYWNYNLLDSNICPKCKIRDNESQRNNWKFPPERAGRNLKSVLDEGSYDGLCGACNDGNIVTGKCEQCNEYLCDMCVSTHKQVKLNKHHAIYLFRNFAQPFEGNPTNRSRDQFNEYNSIYYCMLCKQKTSKNCLQNHRVHLKFNIIDYQKIRRQSEMKITECKIKREGTLKIDKILNNINQVMLNIDYIAKNESEKVKYFDNCKRILDEMIIELLWLIGIIKVVKPTVLEEQIKSLTVQRQTSRDSIESIENPVGSFNIINGTRFRNDMSYSINDINNQFTNLKISEGDISFILPNAALYTAIRNLGFISTNACAENSIVFHLRNMTTTIYGRTLNVNVFAVDHLGNPTVVGDDDVKATLSSPRSSSDIKILDYHKGNCIVSLFLKIQSQYVLSITIKGIHITESSFIINAINSRRYTLMSNRLMFGRKGIQDGQFDTPWGVCTDYKDHIIVADRRNHRIQVFYPNGQFKHKFGSEGHGLGELNRPAGVATNSENHIIVADKDNHRIQVFTFEGIFMRKFGGQGSGNGMFHYPWDVAVNSHNQILVSDTKNHRIQLFSPTGIFLMKYNFGNQYSKKFNSPRGVVFNAEDDALVTEFNSHCVVVIKSDFRSRRIIGTEGSGNGELCRPQGIAVDSAGNIIIAESKNHRIQIFSPEGKFITRFGSYGPGINPEDCLSGVCVTKAGFIVVVDAKHNRIIVF